MPGQVEVDAIWAMLDDCCPGWTKMKKKHRWWVGWRGNDFKQLPLGAHAKRKGGGGGAEVRIGDVRALVRFLGVPGECARRHFAQLGSTLAATAAPVAVNGSSPAGGSSAT